MSRSDLATQMHSTRAMEGPSLVILREELKPFLGKKVTRSSGNLKQPKELLLGRKLARIETWGKVLFLTFSKPKMPDIITKTHFLMFGSYRINDPKPERDPRLQLDFKNGTLYFYSCSIQFGAEDYRAQVDHQVDIMAPEWKLSHVLQLMKRRPGTLLCDLLLDQTIFAGSGNIIKNEVLFNIRCNPLTPLCKIPEADWRKIAQAVRRYGADFYKWKKLFELRKHWQVYRKKYCPVCGSIISRAKTGKLERGSFFCPSCQASRSRMKSLKVFPVVPLKGPATKEKRFDH